MDPCGTILGQSWDNLDPIWVLLDPNWILARESEPGLGNLSQSRNYLPGTGNHEPRNYGIGPPHRPPPRNPRNPLIFEYFFEFFWYFREF